jgi:hypothetical protein
MRHSALVAAVVVLVSGLRVEAKCSAEWASVQPSDVVLPLRPHVLVTLGGRLKEIRGDGLLFESGVTRIPAVEVLAMAGYSQRVMLVKPSKPLTPGRWTLRLGFKPMDARTPSELAGWTVADVKDETPPALTGTPEVDDVSWEELGCGPAQTVSVTGLTVSEPHVVVEAVVRTKEGTLTGLFWPRDGRIDLGHGMCSGGLELPAGPASVVFTPIDLFGNRGASSAPVSFKAKGAPER